jgi:hypothetical protein
MNKIYATIERRSQENALSNPTIDLLLLYLISLGEQAYLKSQKKLIL